MVRKFLLVVVAWLALAALPAAAQAGGVTFRAGSAGIGDPYFPLDGNGGYDVAHYDLNIHYDPSSDVLSGLAKLDITAKQDLSRFNLDLVGMNVHAILVDGRAARWTRDEGELTITPRNGLRSRPEVLGADRLRRRAGDDRRRPDRHVRVHAHRRRRARGRSARRRGDLVPRQRPPARQGVLHVPDRGPARAGGDRERRAEGRPQHRPVVGVGVGRARADGVVPGDGLDGRVRRQVLPGGRDQVLGRDRSGPVHAARAAHRQPVRALATSRSRRSSG